MTDAVIVAAARSAIGRAVKGRLASTRADDLAAEVTAATLAKVPAVVPAEIDDLYLGASQHTGEQAQSLGRRVAVLLGLDSVPSVTVNRACASSVQTTRMACHAIKAGEGDAFLSVGVEASSRLVPAPPEAANPRFAAAAARTAARPAGSWFEPRLSNELPDFYVAMGRTAENVAALCDVSREAQDEFALISQRRAQSAIEAGVFADEIVPITLPDGSTFDRDESPRAGTTVEALAALKPAFVADGTVTAGNSCPLNDGAAALMVLSNERCRDLGLQPEARILASAATALSPEIMGLGPIQAVRKALGTAGLSIADIDLFEINEAFAAQVIACQRELEIDIDKLNVHGGAIALGHPFGMSGARLIMTAINALRRTDQQIATVTMCVGYGQGMAMVIERLS